ncbi:hypothetical protein [Bacillus toyonensis]|uniref:hypothetical protein n=1 Tax=Bacillus toyonensis TaxID=155322 RepID=UPI002E226D67|nr:hypothetical protein [Bacillus toyonensis]
MSSYTNNNKNLLSSEILSSSDRINSAVAPGFFEYLESLPQETLNFEMSALEEVDKEAAMMLIKHLENTNGKIISKK